MGFLNNLLNKFKCHCESDCNRKKNRKHKQQNHHNHQKPKIKFPKKEEKKGSEGKKNLPQN